jgi:hypothetical protein
VLQLFAFISLLWKDLLQVKSSYLKGRGYKINNGNNISFWLDTWMGDTPLCIVYPYLYDQCWDQKCSVSQVFENGWNIRFKVRLQGTLRAQWYELASNLNGIEVNAEQDKAIWKWAGSKKIQSNLFMISYRFPIKR